MNKIKTPVDQYFGSSIKDFEFTVPADYKHDTQIDTFAEKTKKNTSTTHFSDFLNSVNFEKVTNRLEPGKAYCVQVFPIRGNVQSQSCLDFLKKQGAILVGGQGLTLLQAQKGNELPVEKFIVSFDEKNALCEDEAGLHRLPSVYRYLDDRWKFDCSAVFESIWGDESCLLCISEKKSMDV